MKRILLPFSILVAATAANAAVNLNIDNQYQTTSPGVSSFDLVFTGTIDILIPTFGVTSASLQFPGTGTATLNADFHSDFLNFFGGAGPGDSYSGNLFFVEITPTTELGFYWLNAGGPSGLSAFHITVSDGTTNASEYEFYGVNVVPEPASMAVLGLGAIALIKRRRR